MTQLLSFALAIVAALGLSTPLAYAHPNAIGSFDADLSSRAASQAVGSCGTAGMLSYSACVANHLGGAGAPHINAYDERPYKPSIVQSALTGLPPGTASESSRDFIRDTALNEISSDPQLGSKSFVAVAETDPPQRIEAISDKEYRSIARVMDIRDYALSEMLERALKDTEYRKSNAKALRDKIEDTLSWIGKKKLAEHVQSGTFVTEAALLQFPYSVVGIITTSSSQDSKAVKADTARIAGRFKEIKALLADLYSSTGVDSIQETYYLALARAVMMEPIDEALGLLAPVTDVYMQRRFREGIRIVPLELAPN